MFFALHITLRKGCITWYPEGRWDGATNKRWDRGGEWGQRRPSVRSGEHTTYNMYVTRCGYWWTVAVFFLLDSSNHDLWHCLLLLLLFSPLQSTLPVQFTRPARGPSLFIIETVGTKTGAKILRQVVEPSIHPSIPPNPSSSQFTAQSIVVSGFTFLRATPFSSFIQLLSNY